jgi:hypothetical protein
MKFLLTFSGELVHLIPDIMIEIWRPMPQAGSRGLPEGGNGALLPRVRIPDPQSPEKPITISGPGKKIPQE